jgi:DNA-binding Xre family transcriptional regulator
MKERKVTQKKLALAIGISESSLSRFLSGKQKS